jgi:hypothetical protein
MSESNLDPSESFDIWSKTSEAINDFYEKYLSEPSKFEWAKGKTFSWRNKDTWRGIAIGFFTGCLSSFIVWYLTKQ